jgi:hypothetical protein
MARLIGKIDTVFDISGRVVVVLDLTFAQLPSDVKLRIGDAVEFRQHGEAVTRTQIAGIEHCDPWTPHRLIGILLPANVIKDAVPIGAEFWTLA